MKAFVAMIAAAILAIVLVAVATTKDDNHDHADDASHPVAAAEPTPVAHAPAPAADQAKQMSRDAAPAATTTADTPARRAPSGPIAPDFELQLGNGTPIRLSDHKGEVVVLDFWATWCGPCMAVLPQVDAFSKWAEANQQPISVYAVHTMERGSRDFVQQSVQQMWMSKNFSMLVLFDFGSNVARQFNVRSIPQTFVIGPDGRVVAHHVGFDRTKDLTEVLKQECLGALD